jgi:hypothetical protein
MIGSYYIQLDLLVHENQGKISIFPSDLTSDFSHVKIRSEALGVRLVVGQRSLEP